MFGDQGESFQDIPGATSALRYNENVDASGKSSHIAPESVFALRTCHPVSYTHLDVYKRQEKLRPSVTAFQASPSRLTSK